MSVLFRRALVLGLALLISLSLVATLPARAGSPSLPGAPHARPPAVLLPAARANAPSAVPAVAAPAGGSSPSSAADRFDERVLRTASALGAAGLAPGELRLPYIGTPARLVDGAVEPGYAVGAGPVGPFYSNAPAPAGIAYYGENDSDGEVTATVLNASSLSGSLSVNRLSALYLDVDTPDDWGIQENAVLGNVTLQNTSGYEFWTQNAVDVYQSNQTISLGEDTWNWSSPTAGIFPGQGTILSHDPNGTYIAGLYIGEGPWLYAPAPFTLTLYLNSSVTSGGDQELWYNYSLAARGGIHTSGNYDWIVFNSGGNLAPGDVAPFVADGTQLDPVGETNDFELDYGIGSYNGASMNVLDAEVSANLSYCPADRTTCAGSQYLPVPAALDFGSETGETSTGLAFTYQGTNESATAGPFILRGLWGYSGLTGSAAGATPVTNHITVSGSPLTVRTAPYVFVFLWTASAYSSDYTWAPDVPVWYLAPGVYDYAVLLSDYEEQTGTLTVGSSPLTLSVTLPYDPSSGVYTPLWAFSNAQLRGISSSGDGTIGDQYVLFNNPTDGCVDCGEAANGNLSSFFYSYNDYTYPTFAGLLIDGTDAYVTVEDPVSFCVDWFAYGPTGPDQPSVSFDLQLEFVDAHHVTLADANVTGGWPVMFEVESNAGLVGPDQNFFPQADVMFWNSSHDLVMSSTFVPTINPPFYGSVPSGVSPAWECGACVSPDALLFYGGGHNTVWNNTFHDPAVPGLGDLFTTYAGLVLGESGDLVYNNNFSIDNPVVYLPFDIYRDACPDGFAGGCGPLVPPAYRDAWNVPLQPASDISATVNGFPLSGNVLGPGYSSQGGNYWSNYGGLLNPIGVLPYVNTYNYSDYPGTGVLPAGTPAVHRGLLVGGDHFPLLRSRAGEVEITFSRTGLPSRSLWEATIGADAVWYGSDGRTITLWAPLGDQSFSVAVAAGYVLESIQGPNGATLTTVNITGTSVFLLKFG